MRLVIDGRRLTADRTGVGRYLELLLKEWSLQGLPMSKGLLLLQDERVLNEIPPIFGLEIRAAGSGAPGIVWEHAVLGRSLQPGDLLFAPANLVPFTWQGPTALVLHDVIGEILPRTFPLHRRVWYGARYRAAVKRASRIIVPSRSTETDARLVYKIDDDRIAVVPCAPAAGFHPRKPTDPFVLQAKAEIGLENDRPFFLFVGKRSQRRNIPSIIQAFRMFNQEKQEYRLIFAGPSAGFDDRERMETGNVKIVGRVRESTLQGLMNAATALLYPSDYEGFGLPVVEAMASGCPVVALRNSAVEEVSGEAVWYLPTSKPIDLLTAMNALTETPFERDRLIELGLRRAERFQRADFAAGVGRVLADLAEEIRRGDDGCRASGGMLEKSPKIRGKSDQTRSIRSFRSLI
jgi:glycosyltransferase involved in cell wall biosynthesis